MCFVGGGVGIRYHRLGKGKGKENFASLLSRTRNYKGDSPLIYNTMGKSSHQKHSFKNIYDVISLQMQINIEGSLPRGGHSFFHSFNQHVFGVLYVPRVMLGIGIQVRQVSSPWGAQGVVRRTGKKLQDKSSGEVCTEPVGILLSCLPGVQKETLSDGKEVSSVNTAGSGRAAGVSTVVFHEGWVNERWAVMLTMEKGMWHGWEHLLSLAPRLVSPPLTLIQLPSQKPDCHLVP